MSSLLLGTNVVSLDEPCYSLKELLGPAVDSRGVRRWQAIKVVRGERVVECRRDLGPASAFTAGEFVIPGGVADERTGRIEILHRVGELIDIADLLRSDAYQPPEPPRPRDLIQGYYDQADKRRKRRRAVSQFGPKAKIQRS